LNYYEINSKFYFVDLPGYGYSKVPHDLKNKWRELLDHYLNEAKHIKAIVQLLDFRHLPSKEDIDMIEWLVSSDVNYIIVFTKIDKIGSTLRHRQLKTLIEKTGLAKENIVLFSSGKKKIGVEELWAKINIFLSVDN